MVDLILLAYQVSDRGDCLNSYMIRVHDDAVRMFVIRALGKFPMWSYSEGLSSFSLACSPQYPLSPKSNCKVNRFSLLLSIVIGLATAEKKH
jgi:hypothetical protein